MSFSRRISYQAKKKCNSMNCSVWISFWRSISLWKVRFIGDMLYLCWQSSPDICVLTDGGFCIICADIYLRLIILRRMWMCTYILPCGKSIQTRLMIFGQNLVKIGFVNFTTGDFITVVVLSTVRCTKLTFSQTKSCSDFEKKAEHLFIIIL